MTKNKKKCAKKKSGRVDYTPADRNPKQSTSESKAFNARRRTSAESHDPGQHPVDQSWRGWDFEDWLDRPAGRCEVDPERGKVPKRLTEDTAVHVARMLAEGLYQYHVEGLLGLAERAISNWIYISKKHAEKRKDWRRKAKRFTTKAGAEESLGPQPIVTLHMKFATMVRKSEAMGEVSLFGALVNYAMQGDAKTAQWILERKHPERYGKAAMRGDVERDDDGKPKVNPMRELADALQTAADRAEDES